MRAAVHVGCQAAKRAVRIEAREGRLDPEAFAGVYKRYDKDGTYQEDSKKAQTAGRVWEVVKKGGSPTSTLLGRLPDHHHGTVELRRGSDRAPDAELGDSIYDSSVFLDNFSFSTTSCSGGAGLADMIVSPQSGLFTPSQTFDFTLRGVRTSASYVLRPFTRGPWAESAPPRS